MSYIPKHVAIIMDGNGRWAAKQNKPRTYGHYKGTENVRNIAKRARDLGVEVLTLYAFSTENWKRPEDEVGYLMGLPAVFLKNFLAELMENGIKVETIGNIAALPEKTQKVIGQALETTKDNKNMKLVFAVNYGGRDEIVDAVNRYTEDVRAGKAEYPVDEEGFEKYLATGKYPPLDLLIRTSLDYRISNFLLWQLSYAELYFTDKYWPEFTPEDFEEAITSFSSRQRRFGGLK